MRKIPISGGPSTGKTTLFNALRAEYPDAHFVEEAATTVIKKELEKQKDDPLYEPVMPVTNYRGFAPLVMAQQVADIEAIPEDAELVFLDRCIIDNLGYLAFNGVTDFVPEVRSQAKAAKFTMAFFCDWLGKFEQSDIRRETAEEGLAVHQHLEAAYHESELSVVHLPAVSVADRLQIVRTAIH
jgi:predicted ATPase